MLKITQLESGRVRIQIWVVQLVWVPNPIAVLSTHESGVQSVSQLGLVNVADCFTLHVKKLLTASLTPAASSLVALRHAIGQKSMGNPEQTQPDDKGESCQLPMTTSSRRIPEVGRGHRSISSACRVLRGAGPGMEGILSSQSQRQEVASLFCLDLQEGPLPGLLPLLSF